MTTYKETLGKCVARERPRIFFREITSAVIIPLIMAAWIVVAYLVNRTFNLDPNLFGGMLLASLAMLGVVVVLAFIAFLVVSYKEHLDSVAFAYCYDQRYAGAQMSELVGLITQALAPLGYEPTPALVDAIGIRLHGNVNVDCTVEDWPALRDGLVKHYKIIAEAWKLNPALCQNNHGHPVSYYLKTVV